MKKKGNKIQTSEEGEKSHIKRNKKCKTKEVINLWKKSYKTRKTNKKTFKDSVKKASKSCTKNYEKSNIN